LVLLGNLPLMTKRGHFILNGSPRVIINQMVRSPGIYYQEVIHKNKKRTYYADLISHRGAWLRLETDKKRRVWVRMKKTPKVSVLVFLQALGLSKEKFFQSINYSNFLKSSFLEEEEDHPISSDQALRTFYFETHPKKEKSEITPDLGQKFLLRKFFNSRTYDLSKLGRIQLNKKLGLSIPLTKSILTEQDILFATDYLIKLEYGLGTLDDIDDLKNRRVRASGELIQNQLGTGFIRLEKMIREKLKKPRKKLTVRSLITTKPVNGALREFFGSSQLSQFMDQTNPLAELTHKRRLSSLGPGGISRETAGMAVRGIHPSHYGRICPIETPEGPNAGLVNSLTTYAKINSEGFIETPFYKVYKGQIQSSAGPIFFSAAQEEHVTIAPGDLKLSQLDFLPKSTIPVRATKEFKKIIRDEVEYISISPIQMISIATSLIPFLEHDDANRALMGSNMQRQAVPLIAPERPIVGTGLEGRVVADSGHGIQARTSGFVSYVSGEQIIIKNCIEPTVKIKSVFSKLCKKTKSFSGQSLNSNIYNFLENTNRFSLKQGQITSSIGFSSLASEVKQGNGNRKHEYQPNVVLQPGSPRSPLAIARAMGATDHPLTFRSSTNKKNLKPGFPTRARFKHNLEPGFPTPLATARAVGATARALKINVSTIKTDLQLKRFSIIKTLFSFVDQDLSEINFSTQKELNEKNRFNKEKINTGRSPGREPGLNNLKQSKLFQFSKFKDLFYRDKFITKQGLVFSTSFEKKGQFSANQTRVPKFKSSAFKPSFTSVACKAYPGYDKNTLQKPGFPTRATVTLRKVTPREKNVSKNHSYFQKNNVSYYVQKTFVIKTNILKLNLKGKLNWYYFLDSGLLNRKKLYNTNFDTRQLKFAFKFEFNEVNGWNRFYKLPVARLGNPGKLYSLNFLPYDYKVTGYLSDVNYFINFNRSIFPATNQTRVPYPGYDTLNPVKTKVNGLSNNSKYLLNNHQSLTNNKFNIEKNFSISSVYYFLDKYQRSNQDTCLTQRPIVHEGEWVQKGDLLADGTASVGGEVSLGKTILVAYMPWEGYNFEDAILISERLIYNDIYTSIHIERYEIEIRDTKFGVEQITNQIPEIEVSELSHLDSRGITKIGSWIKEGDILVGKITPIQKKSLSPHEKLLYDVVKKEIPTTRDTSLRVPKSVHGRVVDIQILETENIPPEIDFEGPGRVHIYVAEKRKIQVGDKMAGRHGNKGIVSKILPRQDMPYLPDGTPIDMVLNPLGVPSRMNVGQVFECLLGLAGKELDQQFKIIPFDEIYGPEASRSLVYSKLFEARLKTGQKWLFDPNFAGKTKIFDGRSGESFDQAVTVGQAYMLKLVHLVDEKIHARSTGPYSLVTQQPLRGRSKHGGQRLGEMEVWALEGFGAAYTLQELLTVKSDDMKGRHQVMDAILNNRPISLGTPESFKVLIRELQSLCLDVGVFTIESSGRRKQIDVMKLA
jgi:DNA-directed RNA polymerase beta subunit